MCESAAARRDDPDEEYILSNGKEMKECKIREARRGNILMRFLEAEGESIMIKRGTRGREEGTNPHGMVEERMECDDIRPELRMGTARRKRTEDQHDEVKR